MFVSRLNNKISFCAGWNIQVTEQIKACNIDVISDRFSKTGIETDFNGNKIVAWCCNKTADIFRQLNEKYKLNLALPKGIFVEDFSKLKINGEKLGFCNWLPSPVSKDSDKIFPERTLFFDKKFPWENIDPYTEDLHKSGFWASNHFLTSVIHEYGHSAHDNHLIDISDPKDILEILEKLKNKQFDQKTGKIISDISIRAAHNPLETVAEDMAGKIVSSLDSNLLPTENPFKSSSYPDASFLTRLQILLTGNKNNLIRESLLRKSWNGTV